MYATPEIAAIIKTLTPAQKAALLVLDGKTMAFYQASELEVSPAALAALERKGLLKVRVRRFASSNPRQRVSSEPVERSYSLTGRSFSVLRIIRAA